MSELEWWFEPIPEKKVEEKQHLLDFATQEAIRMIDENRKYIQEQYWDAIWHFYWVYQEYESADENPEQSEQERLEYFEVVKASALQYIENEINTATWESQIEDLNRYYDNVASLTYETMLIDMRAVLQTNNLAEKINYKKVLEDAKIQNTQWELVHLKDEVLRSIEMSESVDGLPTLSNFLEQNWFVQRAYWSTTDSYSEPTAWRNIYTNENIWLTIEFWVKNNNMQDWVISITDSQTHTTHNVSIQRFSETMRDILKQRE